MADVRRSGLAGTWHAPGDGGEVRFSGRAFRLAPVFAARFPEVDATVHLGEGEQRVDVDVRLGSMTTGNPGWDDLLSTLDPFDLAHHPVGAFRSSRVSVHGDVAVVAGALALRGREAPVRLTGRTTVLSADRARLQATGTVDRRAFGLSLGLPGGDRLVPCQLRVDVDLQVVRDDA